MAEPGVARLPAGAENISARGFNLHAGPFFRVSSSEDARSARYAFIALEKHMNSAGAVHGGLLLTFADIAMSRTARMKAGAPCSTVSFAGDFVGPGRLGEMIEAHVEVKRMTRTLVFQTAELVVKDRVLVLASGVWRIVA